MVLAGINNVLALETPYLGENYSSVSLNRTSIIRKLWRDLESENRTRETQRQQTGGMADGNSGSQCSCSLKGAESEDVSVTTSEAENECPRDQNQMEIQSGQENNGNLCIIGVADKERASKNGSGPAAWNVSHKTNVSRDQSPCETECKRVRAVRQWIESNPQQETGRPVIDEQAPETGCQVEQVCGGSGVDHTQGGVRRPVRGRQAFLDLLARFETERAKEMPISSESQLVSKFSHRNHIQASFRGRFLRNQSFVQDEKPSSTATKELGLLRQSNTVSDLRKGFLSGSADDEQTLDGPQSDTSSDIDIRGILACQDVPVETEERHEQIIKENDSEWDDLTNTKVNKGSSAKLTENEVESVEERHGVLENEVQPPPPPPVEVTENRDQDQDGSVERSHGAYYIEPSQRTLAIEIPARGQYLLSMEELEVNESLDHHSLTSSETSSLREGSVETEVWQEPTIEENGNEWDQLTNTEIFESSDANSVRNEDEWYQEAAGNDFQESLENWCGVGTSYQEAPLVVTTSVFYTSGDDNGNRPELRELMNRRRVSNLLQSDFRVRLDQVVQSYAERRDQALESDDDWMLDQEQQHLDQQSVDENEDVTETAEISKVAYPDIHQHSRVEWDIINGLRLDMAKLQERMNSMQSTLETWISMQRSMQQEVSSALSRLSTSGESSLQTCSLCCDNNIHGDSSPDRSGHVYVCSNCAEKVNWSKLKES